LADFLAHCV